MQTYSSATTVSLGICYFGTCGWSPVSARMILTCGSFGWIYLTICKASLMCKLILLSAVCIQKPNRDKGLQILLGGTSVPVKCVSTAFFFFFFLVLWCSGCNNCISKRMGGYPSKLFLKSTLGSAGGVPEALLAALKAARSPAAWGL